MPSVEMFRMLGSGTEGVMAAIRAARRVYQEEIYYQGRRRVSRLERPNGLRLAHPRHGSSRSKRDTARRERLHTRVLSKRPRTLKRQLLFNKLRGGTAAVIVEPVGPESGTRPVSYEFNQKVRELCDDFGVLLIFDEVVTGFRLGLGGAQGYFNVKPDLTVFGKCIAGGYPMAGGVGGRSEVVAAFAAGIGGVGNAPMWRHAFGKSAFVRGGLLCPARNRKNKRRGARRPGGRQAHKRSAGHHRKIFPTVVAYNQGSIVHLETAGTILLDFKHPLRLLKELKPRKHMMEEMGAAYMANGLVTLAGSRMYTSMADTDEVIDEALNRFESVFERMSVNNIAPTKSPAVRELFHSLEHHLLINALFENNLKAQVFTDNDSRPQAGLIAYNSRFILCGDPNASCIQRRLAPSFC